MYKISDEIRNQVINLRKEGKTYQEIVEITGVGKGSISNICKENGLGQKIIELTPEKIKEAQELYDKIGNIKKVAKEIGISFDRLRNVIVSKTITPKSSYENLKTHRKKIKEELIAYKGGECQLCHYNKCSASLDFHHLDPNEKDFGISQNNTYRNIDKMKQEVDKCILVCANCHREIHYKLSNPEYDSDILERIKEL